MGKIEINNEIVLLRHTVRQARVCIVNKLIREAKLLRDKNGNETQRERNKRKADKLVAEVYALKTIKDDEISKFGIMNEKEVKDILQNQSSNNRDRIIARIVGYKSFHRRLIQFRERFPDYKMYLSGGKKSTTKSKKKNSVKSKKSLAENNHLQHEGTKKQNVDSDKIIEDSRHNSEDEESCASKLCETKNHTGKRKKSSKEDSTALVNKKLPKLVEDNISEDANRQPSEIKLCSITREATVKRFAELLEEQDSTRDAQTSAGSLLADHAHASTVQAKAVDDFFMTGNDESHQEYRTNASTSRTRFDTPTKTLRSRNRVETQNAKYKNGERIGDSRTPKNNQFKKQLRGEKTAGRSKYSDEQSSATKQEKRTSNRINKSTNKNNLNVVNDGGKTADLHPSWLAKKKQQEVMSQGFQGKKIVFADD